MLRARGILVRAVKFIVGILLGIALAVSAGGVVPYGTSEVVRYGPAPKLIVCTVPVIVMVTS